MVHHRPSRRCWATAAAVRDGRLPADRAAAAPTRRATAARTTWRRTGSAADRHDLVATPTPATRRRRPTWPRTDPYEPFAHRGRRARGRGLVVLGQVADGVTVDDLTVGQRGRAGGRRPCSPRATAPTSTWMWNAGSPSDRRRGSEPMAEDVAIPGVGMTPGASGAPTSSSTAWRRPAEALADAGVAWTDIAVRGRRRDRPQRLPRLRRRAPRSPRRSGGPAPGSSTSYARLRLGRHGHRRRPHPDPGRPVRRRPGRRGRHHAQGVPGPQRRRPPRRPRLAALPAARRHQPHVLRAVRPPPHGPLRRHARATSPR